MTPAGRVLAAGNGQAPCRFCGTPLGAAFADLGSSPLANSYLSRERLGWMVPFTHCGVLVCGGCFLVQLEEFESPDRSLGLRLLLFLLQ